jgi:hypothetical protein
MISDTTVEAEQVLVELLRQAPIWRKLEMMGQKWIFSFPRIGRLTGSNWGEPKLRSGW